MIHLTHIFVFAMGMFGGVCLSALTLYLLIHRMPVIQLADLMNRLKHAN